jgi:hypothetical protein
LSAAPPADVVRQLMTQSLSPPIRSVIQGNADNGGDHLVPRGAFAVAAKFAGLENSVARPIDRAPTHPSATPGPGHRASMATFVGRAAQQKTLFIMPGSRLCRYLFLPSRTRWPPARLRRHNQRDSRKITDRPVAVIRDFTHYGAREPLATHWHCR